MKKIIILILINITCISCDPVGDKLLFNNNSNSNVYLRIFNINNNDLSSSLGLMKKKHETEIKIIGRWAEKSNDNIRVIVYNDYKYLSDSKEQSSNIKADSLLKIGDYKYKDYKYGELENNKWKIQYPNDGFLKGVPFTVNY